MINLELAKKSGFSIDEKNTPIIIHDYRGMEFYNNTSIPVDHRSKFNLPKGNYEIKVGVFHKLMYPVLFSKNILPFPQRFRTYPNDFKMEFGTNKNKATIFWNEKLILFDSSLLRYSLPVLFFILFHEFAHAKYSTETNADLLSENMMLDYGFNPSQVASASVIILSAKQHKRKSNAVNRLISRS